MELIYDLYGIIVHNGFSSTSGHYFSFIRSSPNTWHRLDDSKVMFTYYNLLCSSVYRAIFKGLFFIGLHTLSWFLFIYLFVGVSVFGCIV